MKTGNRPKKGETDQQTENLKLYWNPEMDPKNEETDPKKEEIDQETENLKLLLKTRNGPKNWVNVSKILGNPSKILGIP